ncbi:DUF72 domain-containing protein [Aquimarina sp. W85]|uniref:DUF72 domain-containing protein n=1 Tax=Aquimarina rhodophyticola TaxID=3342246 RepID=UPI00366E4817
MKFGKVDNPQTIDFRMPNDNPATERLLVTGKSKALEVYVGCAKWNKQELKGFYPKGTKDELRYYATQFNAIELNATFYQLFAGDQFEKWYAKTPAEFKFFPKLIQDISHNKRLESDVFMIVQEFLRNAVYLKEKLGTIFLQMPISFDPTQINKLYQFIKAWPSNISLAVELRHPDWYNDDLLATLGTFLEQFNIALIITDTAGRRDMLHMRLTNKEAFIRFVGSNHVSDYMRLDDWVERLARWKTQGLEKLHFFIHQHIEKESPLLASYFIQKLNMRLQLDLSLPTDHSKTLRLF